MFIKRYNIVDKGFYSHSQSNRCVSVKQYIIVKESAKKILLLRFWNGSDLSISGMEFVLTQIGLDKQVIDTSVVKLDGMTLNPGDTYTMDNGIVINAKCVDFEVSIRYVKSGAYEYYDLGGKTVPKYNPKPKAKRRSKSYGITVVTKQKMFSSKLAALVAVLLILGFVGISTYLSARTFGNFSSVAQIFTTRIL